MGRKLALKVVGKQREMDVKVREYLTMNNFKAIIKGEMQLRTGKAKIMHEGKELSGHRRLVDKGLVDGDKLEVKALKLT